MDFYKIQWKRSALKELRKKDRSVIARIIESVESLANNPIPHGSRKIQGTDHTYRIRVGDYRIVYSVESHILLIEIIRVGHRKDIYQKFK